MMDSFGKEISRRGFIKKVGQGFVAAHVAGTFLKEAAVNEVTIPEDALNKVGHRSIPFSIIFQKAGNFAAVTVSAASSAY